MTAMTQLERDLTAANIHLLRLVDRLVADLARERGVTEAVIRLNYRTERNSP